MTIYIVDTDIDKCASYLDDQSLKEMITSISKVLCSVHYELIYDMPKKRVYTPLDVTKEYSKVIGQWSKWASKNDENYKYLVELGFKCLDEYCMRINADPHYIKNREIISWAEAHIPFLQKKTRMLNKLNELELPILIPNKYIVNSKISENVTISSYRNYLRNRLKRKNSIKHGDVIYTQRVMPSWVEL